MKNKKLIAAATFAALTIGGLSANSLVSAQSYGDGSDTTDQSAEAPSSDTGFEVDSEGQDNVVTVQDADDENLEGANPEGESPDHARRGHRGGCNLEDAAAAIGIEESELRASLDEGQSIAEVAEANGVDVESVIDAMGAAESEHITEKVEEGRISQDEADEKLAELDSRITERVNGAEDAPGS